MPTPVAKYPTQRKCEGTLLNESPRNVFARNNWRIYYDKISEETSPIHNNGEESSDSVDGSRVLHPGVSSLLYFSAGNVS